MLWIFLEFGIATFWLNRVGFLSPKVASDVQKGNGSEFPKDRQALGRNQGTQEWDTF